MEQRPLTRQQWGRLALSAYLPTGLSMVGLGAVSPLLALTARQLGGSVADAAFVVALYGIGTLVGALPAGELADRFGERICMIGALVIESGMLFAVPFAPNVIVLDILVTVMGLTAAMLGLARQAYITDVVPLATRARALSTLGGVFRLGTFVGPLLGSAVVAGFGLTAAYVMAGVTSLTGAIVTAVVPELPGEHQPVGETPPSGLWSVLRSNARVYATQGLGAAVIMILRTAKDAIIPLWCESLGIDAAATSLLYALSSGVDMLLFYAGGSLMDRYGRKSVAVPGTALMGLAFGVLPLTRSLLTVALMVSLLGLANGLMSGVVMTIGSDASPAEGRARFLSGWRFCSGSGQAVGPLIITGIAGLAGLGAAAIAIGAIGFAGAAWLWRWVPSRVS